MNGRAKVGGEQGINGEWYDGGQFLPSSPFTVKGEHTSSTRKGKSKKAHKQEIAPYKWEIAPEGYRSIFSIVAGTFGRWSDYGKEFEYNGSEAILNYVGLTEQEARDLIAAWNSGQRWVKRG